jgi:hypothetical protein
MGFMNERFRELATEVGISTEYLTNTKQIVLIEKFAELIVQEAIAVVNKRYMGDNNREDMEVLRCVEDLKKHFGVK